MNRKLYQVPATKVNSLNKLKKTTDMHDSKLVGSFIRSTTEKQLSNLFSNWIDEDIKRQTDILDLQEIKWDIDNCENFSDVNNMPETSIASNWQFIINAFSEVKEEDIWKNINFNDIPEIDRISDYITIIQPHINWKISKKENLKNIWINNIVRAIRNWLMHNRYLITENGFYIHNKKAWKKKTNRRDKNWNNIVEEQAFEAFINPIFLKKIISFCRLSTRKLKVFTFNTNSIIRKKWFDKNKERLCLNRYGSNNKWSMLYESREDLLLGMWDKSRSEEIQKRSEKLSDGENKFISKYFKSSKHEFNFKNLFSLLINMKYPDTSGDMIRGTIDLQKNLLDFKKNLKKELFFSECWRINIINLFLDWENTQKWNIWKDSNMINKIIDDNFKNYSNDNKKIIKSKILKIKYHLLNLQDNFSLRFVFRKNYLKVLYLSKFYVNNPKLKPAQPQKREGDKLRKQWRDYIMNKCKNNPESYWSKKIKQKNINKNIKTPYRESVFKELTSWKVIDGWIIKKNDDVNKMMNEINIFCTKDTKHLRSDYKQILEDNVRNVIKDWKEKLDNITIIWEEEHIRNAFAHHNYTIVPWFNKILLWDPSIDDTPNWEKVYDLDELYQNAVNRVNEDYLDKKIEA